MRPKSVLFTAGVLASLLLAGLPHSARSSADEVVLEPQAPATTVWILTAPHVGQKVCEVPASTRVRAIAGARHGPHRYAEIEVLEGDCSGEKGYVPWSTLDPKPSLD